jgi:hypothetical protein
MGKTFTISDAYKRFKKENPKGSKHYLTEKQYKEICYEFNRKIVNFVLLDAGEFRVPHRIGVIRIKKRKTDMNNLRIDFGEFRKTGKKIYHLNEHSKEYYYRWYWQKKQAIIKNKSAYSFRATRTNKRIIKQLVTNKNITIDYLQ